MVRERNDTGANSENHTGMNLRMRVSNVLRFFKVEILNRHGDHSRLFLFDVEELNQTLLTAGFKVPLAPLVLQLAVKHHLDVPLSQLKLVVFNNEEGTLHSASIRAKLNLLSREVANNTNLTLDSRITAKCLKLFVKPMRVTRKTDPITIHKHFGLPGVQ
jgi:hypothetical protein